MGLPLGLSNDKHFRICVVCSLVLLSVLPASAMARGFYSAFDAGQSSFRDTFCQEVVLDMRCSHSASAIRLGGGYQFSQNIGIEVDFDYLGNGKENWKVLQVGVVRTVPLSNNLSLLGKLGMAEVWVDYIYSYDNYHDEGSVGPWTVFSGGLGIQYDISKRFAVRAQYEYFNGLNIVSKDLIFSLSSIGVVLRF
jgi:opacity protein-like surface antigen